MDRNHISYFKFQIHSHKMAREVQKYGWTDKAPSLAHHSFTSITES